MRCSSRSGDFQSRSLWYGRCIAEPDSKHASAALCVELREVVTMLPAFAIEHVQGSADQGEIRIRGSLRLAEAAPLWTELRRLETSASRGQTLNFDMSAVQRIDGGAMALLACVRGELQRRGVKSEFVAADAHVQRIIHLYGGDHAVARLKRRRPLGTLDQLGRATGSILLEVRLVFAFLGQMLVAGARVFRSPVSAHWRELPATNERSRAHAGS